MPIYIMASRLTDEGRKTIKERPERIKEVNEEVVQMGAKLIAQYAILGPYDFINILEAKDDETIVQIAIQLGARGTLQMETFAAIPVDDLVKKLKK
ncbi:MAG TPA: GYD domain-containing protein [Thermoplasmata archaeon]|nr:GYD domain-containing protein [Thermoplasmata archaeon]HIH97556.1 GYD domain-containing protein [Thermoplasmata archaeon]